MPTILMLAAAWTFCAAAGPYGNEYAFTLALTAFVLASVISYFDKRNQKGKRP